MRALNTFLSNQLFNTSSAQAFIEPVIQAFSPDFRISEPTSKVTGVSWNNRNTYTVRIKPHKSWKKFHPGQFVQLSLEKDGAYLSRCFSISSTPEHFRSTGEIEVTVKAHKKGKVTPWIPEAIKAGSRVYLSQAQGDFTLRESSHRKLFIAGGSGITPIISMLRANTSAEWMNSAVLIFYVRQASDRIFISELKQLGLKGLRYEFIYTSTQGRFSPSHLTQACPDFVDRDIYMCGPGGMISDVTETSQQEGVSEDQLFSEYFSQQISNVDPDEISDEAIEIHYEQSRTQQTLNPSRTQKTLLELAEGSGLSPTSGCRIGVCHQCICKKKQGRVYNTKTKQISDTGEEEIQLCLSIPLDNVALEL